MIYPIYCIRDNKVGFDTQLMLQANEQVAVRGFSYMVNNPQGIPGFAPADFDLFEIGSFDSDTGELKPQLPRFVVNGVNVLNEK